MNVRWLRVAVVGAIVASSAPTRADETGAVTALAIVAGAVVYGTDIGLTAYDASMAANGRRPGRIYGVTEFVLGTAEVIGGIAVSSAESPTKELAYGAAVWGGALAIHGLWVTIMGPTAQPENRSAVVSVGPMKRSPGDRMAPALILAASF
jgi:hypothetical protein